jgi:hypothetical protein
MSGNTAVKAMRMVVNVYNIGMEILKKVYKNIRENLTRVKTLKRVPLEIVFSSFLWSV